jgi:hypothetical protein
MLFPRELHEGIRCGRIRRTYRAWDRARAKVGSKHRFDAAGVIVIQAVETVRWRDVSDANARAAGLQDRAELGRVLERHTSLSPATMLYCVGFRYEAGSDARSALAGTSELTPEERAAIDEKLRRMDERSPHGPWTSETLRVIGEHPRVRAGDLAEMLQRVRVDFKKDVRKLKGLGLTISHEVGYEISPRGRAYLQTKS